MTQQAQHDPSTISLDQSLLMAEGDARRAHQAGAATPRRFWSRLALPGRWFILVFAVVFSLEFLAAIPIIASHRRAWLSERVAVARAAALLLDGSSGRSGVQDERLRTGLDTLGAQAVALEGPSGRRLIGPPGIGADAKRIDIGAETLATSLRAAVSLLFANPSRPVWIVAPKTAHQPVEGIDHRAIALGVANGSSSGQAEILVDEAPLQDSLRNLASQLLLTFLVIAALAGAVISLAVQRDIVRPIRRLAANIGAFAIDPEGIDREIVPTRRGDAIGEVEATFARMQRSLAGELHERRRLAGLGLSVSKINHELRNLLTTAQLLGDRLDGVADPVVQRVAPRLISTLDRAIRFCEATLAYGRATEPYPQRRRVLVEPLLREMEDLAGLSADARLSIKVSVEPDLSIYVDPEQFARALTNIVRNAVQALDAAGTREVEPSVTITARREGDGEGSRVVVLLADNGPGLPQNARVTLFAPFQGSMRAGGTGLGLAIASELVRLNGGTLELDDGTEGACFRIVVPDAKTA